MFSSRGTVGGLDQRYGHDRLYKPGSRKGVLAMYGATGTRDSFFDLDRADRTTLRGIGGFGFAFGTIDVLEYWGNSTIRTNMSTLRTNLQSGTFASGKVHLLGFSAGGTACLNWAKANPTLVQSICLVIPAVDIQDIYDNNRSGFQASISAAYGGRPADADNPADNAASFVDFPIRIYYSTNDTICIASTITTFATATGAELISMGAVGHFWSYTYWGGENAGEFFEEHD